MEASCLSLRFITNTKSKLNRAKLVNVIGYTPTTNKEWHEAFYSYNLALDTLKDHFKERKIRWMVEFKMQRKFLKNWGFNDDPVKESKLGKGTGAFKGQVILETKRVRVPYNMTAKQAVAYIVECHTVTDGYKVDRVVFEGSMKLVAPQGSLGDVDELLGRSLSKVPMKRSWVLDLEWLKHRAHIVPEAYTELDGKCAIKQIVQFCRSNYSKKNGSNQPFLVHADKALPRRQREKQQMKMTEENLIKLLKTSCPTIEQIQDLCETHLSRSMYAINDDNQFIAHYVHPDNGHPPLIFYCSQGHLYLVHDKEASECVYKKAQKLQKDVEITSIADEANVQADTTHEVYHDAEFDPATVKDMPTGVHLMRCSNDEFTDHFKQYVYQHRSVPKHKMDGYFVCQMETTNHAGDPVIVAKDRCFMERVTTQQLEQVAKRLEEPYVNDGIGSIILKAFEKAYMEQRKSIDDDTKQTIRERQGDLCEICGSEARHLEFDHVVPLANGGADDISNMQALCTSCHKEKTAKEKEEGYNWMNRSASTFNDFANETVLKHDDFKALAFVRPVEVHDKVKTETLVEETHYELPPPLPPSNLPQMLLQVLPKPKPVTTTVETKVSLEDMQNHPEKYKWEKLDVNKCRRHILYFAKHAFPVYQVTDIPQPYRGGPIECGYYFLVTTNTMPFQGSGWYCQPLVEYGLTLDIITKKDIRYEFLPATTVPADFFRKGIDYLLRVAEEEGIGKALVNAWVGLMNRSRQEKQMSKYTEDYDDALTYFARARNILGMGGLEKKHDKDLNVHVITETINGTDGPMKLYHGLFSWDADCEKSNRPIYNWVLQSEAVELHRLCRIVEDHGGLVELYSTDAVQYYLPKEQTIDLAAYTWSPAMDKYKHEDPSDLEYTKLAIQRELDEAHYVPGLFKVQWHELEDYQDEFHAEEKEKNEQALSAFCDAIYNMKKSLGIEGMPGVGKSHLVNHLVDRFWTEFKKDENLSFDDDGDAEEKAKDQRIWRLSPTNKGALMIGGVTLERVYRKHANNKKDLAKAMRKVRLIFVDEKSMMDLKYWSLMIVLKRANPHIIFITAGDWKQFPPVNPGYQGNFRDSYCYYELVDGNRVTLTQCRRADKASHCINQRLRNEEGINVASYPVQHTTRINISRLHKTRIRVNAECVAWFQGLHPDRKKHPIPILCVKNNPKRRIDTHAQVFELMEGMPLVAWKNRKAKKDRPRIVNNMRYNVAKIVGDKMTLVPELKIPKMDSTPMDIPLGDLCRYFRLGFCVTSYTAQGESIDEAFTIHDWNWVHRTTKEVDWTGRYVAASRTTKAEYLQIAP